MSFDRRDIRLGMDVYTRDHVYLGTVQRVLSGDSRRPDELVTRGARQESSESGELRGPAPTLPLGNTGPTRQSAHEGYGTAPDSDEFIGGGTIVVTRWWGLRGRRAIPVGLVQVVSLEHVVLAVDGDAL